MSRGAGIACRIRHGHRDRMLAVTHGIEHRRRNTDAPATVRLYNAGKGLVTKLNGDNVARRGTIRHPRDQLCDILFIVIQYVIACNSVDRQNRRRGINGH